MSIPNKLKLNNLNRFYASQLIANVYFWIAISIPYLVFRGFSLNDAFLVIAVYVFSLIVFEFPTSKVAVKFGHKASIALGYGIVSAAMLLMAQDMPFWAYFVASAINGLGFSLVSGSDIALLKNISKDFKKDYANYKTLFEIFFFFVAVIGSMIAYYDLPLTLYITSAFALLGALLVFTVKTTRAPKNKDQGNFYAAAKVGFKFVKKNKLLMMILLTASVLGGYAMSAKTIFSGFSNIYEIELKWVGWIVGFGMVARYVGIKISNKIEIMSVFKLGMILASVFVFAGINLNFWGVVVPMLFGNLLIGMINTRMELEINDQIEEKYKVSILSLRNLMKRLLSALYLSVGGFIIGAVSLNIFLGLLGILILSTIILYKSFYRIHFLTINASEDEFEEATEDATPNEVNEK